MNILEAITEKERMFAEASELKKAKFKPGFDQMSADGADSWLHINHSTLVRKLKRGAYTPSPAIGFNKAKRNGKYRSLAKLTAIDTIIQRCITGVVSPICEEKFSDYSYAYRPKRGVEAAVRQYCALGNTHKLAVLIDPSGCYDNVDHIVLENALQSFIPAQDVCDLIMSYVKMPVVIDGEWLYPDKGIIQGAPICNLLCNVYMHALDIFLEEEGIPFIRYADDIVLFCDSMPEARGLFESVRNFMRAELKLQENPNKCKIDAPAKLVWLGHRFENDRYGLTALAPGENQHNIFTSWVKRTPQNPHRTLDIVKEGILRQKDFSLLFDTDTVDTDIPLEAIDTINVHSSVVLDSGILQKTLKNRMMINIFDSRSKLIGRFIPNTALRSPLLTYSQLTSYYDTQKRLELASSFVLASIHNARLNIRYYNRHITSPQFDRSIRTLNQLSAQIKTCTEYGKLLLLEARAREAYYECYDLFAKDDNFSFEKRTRRPPQNEINAMLSFGNTVLYNLIATEIYKSQLDIRIGFLHATTQRLESLNLDIAEIFKPLLVDRTVFSMINLKVINKNHFVRSENNGIYLTEEGKRQFLRSFYEKLDSRLRVKGEDTTYRQLIIKEIRALSRHFRNGEKYKPFKQEK